MLKMSQKDAVYKAVCLVKNNKIEGRVRLTEHEKMTVTMLMIDFFREGNVRFSNRYSNQEKMTNTNRLMRYTVGLVTNWVAKDKRLNGGEEHVPTPRSADPQLKNLYLLKKASANDPDKLAKIEKFIAKRKAEIAAEKVKTVEIDMSAIPDELKVELDV